jgi:hypothetical protein
MNGIVGDAEARKENGSYVNQACGWWLLTPAAGEVVVRSVSGEALVGV